MTIPQGQGMELSPDQMPPVDPEKVKVYPMVWHNDVTGKPAFMVHSIVAQKLLLKTSPESEVQVVDNVDEVRSWLYKIHRRMLEPERILLAPYKEGDVAVWNNRVSFRCPTSSLLLATGMPFLPIFLENRDCKTDWIEKAMQHTFIEYPDSYGPRTMHQVNLPGSVPPS
jgi:xanthine dioxygenase